MLKLMYITNEPEVAKIAENSGVDRIWIDLEVNGKEERQKGMDTVKSKHKIDDVGKIKKVLKNSELIVRVNPIYENSKYEIDSVIKQGADIVMLPFFKTTEEVEKFIELVGGRCKTMILVETPEAVNIIDKILSIKGINEVHIGLNDLHLGYKKKFMFELLVDGTVEYLCNKFKEHGIKSYGFGGVSKIGTGTLKAENIIIEHYRLGSSIAILSRSFCDTNKVKNVDEIKRIFEEEVRKIRELEYAVRDYTEQQFIDNQLSLKQDIKEILKNM